MLLKNLVGAGIGNPAPPIIATANPLWLVVRELAKILLLIVTEPGGKIRCISVVLLKRTNAPNHPCLYRWKTPG